MIVNIGKDIRIKEYGYNFYTEITQMLTFQNPEYLKKQRMGLWVGKTPRELKLYEQIEDTLVVPFGMLGYVYSKRSENDIFIPRFAENHQKVDFQSTIKPFDYQEPAIEAAVKKKQGIIIAPCGAGKTQIGLEVIARISKKALWLTHTEDLLKQSMNRAKSVFMLPESEYGTITGGKINIGKGITFATVQTMCNIDLKKYENQWDVIVVDECHHVAGTPTKVMMFYKVITSLCARYKFGVTATAKRTDKLENCMFCLLGGKIHEIPKEAVACNTCHVDVITKRTGFEPNYNSILNPDGTINFNLMIKDIIHSNERNKLIIRDVVNADGTCLILTDRIEHIETLAEMLKAEKVPFKKLMSNNTKSEKKEREQAISSLNHGDIKCLIATYALAKEGLDIPTLRNVFFTTPQKNEITVTQSAGRVARKADGKEKGIVYDYVDDFVMLENYGKIRKRIFRKLDYNMYEV